MRCRSLVLGQPNTTMYSRIDAFWLSPMTSSNAYPVSKVDRLAGPFACPVYVINLDRSPLRLDHIKAELAHRRIAPVRVPAVDGRDPHEQEIDQAFDADRARRSYFVEMHRGEVACFLSHRRAWETFLRESDAPCCVILEDDAELSEDFADVVQAIVDRGPIDWDLVKLFIRRKLLSWDAADIGRGHKLIRHLRQPTGTVGQIVSRAGAEKLLAHTDRVYRPLDVQLQHWWELGLRILAVEPPLVREVSRRLDGSNLPPVPNARRSSSLSRDFARAVFRVHLLANSAVHTMRSHRLASKATRDA